MTTAPLSGWSRSPSDNVGRLLDTVDRDEERVRAWTHLDRAALVTLAAEREAEDPRPSPLWGLPVGVKDTIDVAGMPCERGSAVFAGRVPTQDAGVVRRLRAAGALIAGKTVTTELAVTYPGPTTNPHDPTRTPGGSSSGSAAAVAAGMAPIAIGTQTIASTLRPASFCGVVGFKPTHGRVPFDGILSMSPEVDAIGLLGADVDLVAAAFAATADATREAPPVPSRPRIGVLRTPWWDRAEPSSQRALDEAGDLAEATGAVLEHVDLDAVLVPLLEAHWEIVKAGIAEHMSGVAAADPPLLSAELTAVIEAGRTATDASLTAARQVLTDSARGIARHLAGLDALISPCTTGEAPGGLGWTGDPIFCQPWSAVGFPAASLPIATGDHGLPVGVQLVGLPHQDEALLTLAAHWMRSCSRRAS